jgi:competence protein ComEC
MSIAAWYYGRAFKPLTLILLAAAITVVANPLYVWGDIGWYLSFLAFYGVLILSPQIRHRFVPERLRENAIFGIAPESICAEIMTLPLILYIFGQMSHISLVANVVIAAFVPVAMLLTVLAGMAGTFLFPVAGWMAWPATLILTYMLDVAHLLASIPNIFVQGLGFSLVNDGGRLCLRPVLQSGHALAASAESCYNIGITRRAYAAAARFQKYGPCSEDLVKSAT